VTSEGVGRRGGVEASWGSENGRTGGGIEQGVAGVGVGQKGRGCRWEVGGEVMSGGGVVCRGGGGGGGGWGVGGGAKTKTFFRIDPGSQDLHVKNEIPRVEDLEDFFRFFNLNKLSFLYEENGGKI